MNGNTADDQGSETGASDGVNAQTVQLIARSAGLALTPSRAALIAPFVADALAADAVLARLDMGSCGSAGPPWGSHEHDA